jgi:hypothetical protein
VLADILLKFLVWIHQLTCNAIDQLSKYILVVTSFGGVPSAERFAKRYELHYQLRKMEVDGVEVQGQYGCINFHAKHRKSTGDAYCRCQEQMVQSLDASVVLL